MTTNTIVLTIVVLAIALLLIGAVAWVARDKRDRRHRADADLDPDSPTVADGPAPRITRT